MPGMFPISSVLTPVGMPGMPLGIIEFGIPTILVGMAMKPIAVLGLSFSTPHPWGGIPPKPIHPSNPPMLNCSMTVLAGPSMKPVAHAGSIMACKHVCLPGPTMTVLVGV